MSATRLLRPPIGLALALMSLGAVAKVARTDNEASRPAIPIAAKALAPNATVVTTNGAAGLAGSCPNLATAIMALNAASIISPMVITVCGTETAPAGGYSIAATGAAVNPLTITDGGATSITAPTIPAASALNDAILKIIHPFCSVDTPDSLDLGRGPKLLSVV